MHRRLIKGWTLTLILLVASEARAQRAPLSLAHQLTYSYNLDGAPSPDGERIAFIRVIEGWRQVFLMGSDGSGTGGTSLPCSLNGMSTMVRTLCVISSPTRPLPRVRPRTSKPSS